MNFHLLPLQSLLFQKTDNKTTKKRPKQYNMPWAQKFTENVFSHPDYTVGSGFSPDQPLSRVMDFVISDFTIGRDFHPATKTYVYHYLVFKPMMVHLLLAISITTFLSFVKYFF